MRTLLFIICFCIISVSSTNLRGSDCKPVANAGWYYTGYNQNHTRVDGDV
jgi:hypothetical protein